MLFQAYRAPWNRYKAIHIEHTRLVVLDLRFNRASSCPKRLRTSTRRFHPNETLHASCQMPTPTGANGFQILGTRFKSGLITFAGQKIWSTLPKHTPKRQHYLRRPPMGGSKQRVCGQTFLTNSHGPQSMHFSAHLISFRVLPGLAYPCLTNMHCSST